MDLEFVRHLIEAVDESGIDTLEITRAGTRIRISKSPAQVAGSVGGGQAPAATAQAPAPAAQDPAQEAAEAEPAKKGPALTDVNSPMVGTFYRAPAPEAPPYVEVGSTVSKGQTLCILEAMKLMNELDCEVDGIVREILVEDTEPVEYGQVLFRIEPSGSK
jgi:acetyl-CoA carboxylase biotin carboxyl carrier protein